MDIYQLQPILDALLAGAWQVFKVWWWLLLPCIFYFPAKHLYLWWLNWEVWAKEELNWILLEIIPPSEIEKPFRAMEDLITAIWPVIDTANWREVWAEGEFIIDPFWFSLEISAKEGGEVHFYVRILKSQKSFYEAVIHAHYPDIEIKEVPDYTQSVPQDIPNEKYTLYGEDFILMKDNSYPIRTYKFFEIRPEEIEEPKRLDPLNSMLEAMSLLRKGEQFWFQLVAAPITNNHVPWITQSEKLVEVLAKRVEEPTKFKSITGEALRLLFFAKPPFQELDERKESVIPVEMKLTPGEREVLGEVENKKSKLGFKVYMRSIYIAEHDVFFSPNGKIARSYMIHFNTENLNHIRYWNKTRTKVHFFFRKRRVYARQRNMFKKYVNRFPPQYPHRDFGPGISIMNAEEISSIYHFPSKAALLPPAIPRVAAKKVAPPSQIPVEREE